MSHTLLSPKMSPDSALDLSPERARAEATALFQFVVAASAVIAPVFGGYLADAFGYRPVFIVTAGGTRRGCAWLRLVGRTAGSPSGRRVAIGS